MILMASNYFRIGSHHNSQHAVSSMVPGSHLRETNAVACGAIPLQEPPSHPHRSILLLRPLVQRAVAGQIRGFFSDPQLLTIRGRNKQQKRPIAFWCRVCLTTSLNSLKDTSPACRSQSVLDFTRKSIVRSIDLSRKDAWRLTTSELNHTVSFH